MCAVCTWYRIYQVYLIHNNKCMRLNQIVPPIERVSCLKNHDKRSCGRPSALVCFQHANNLQNKRFNSWHDLCFISIIRRWPIGYCLLAVGDHGCWRLRAVFLLRGHGLVDRLAPVPLEGHAITVAYRAQEITYFIRKTTDSNRKFDIINFIKLFILYLFKYGLFILY